MFVKFLLILLQQNNYTKFNKPGIMKNATIIATLALLMMFQGMLFSQNNNVGIGTNNPHASAVLDLESDNQGILIPRLTLTNLNQSLPVTNPAIGLMVYNTGGSLENGFYYWTGSMWKLIGAGGTVEQQCYSLQEAYECDGAANGGVINTISGSPVMINSAINANPALQIVHSANGVCLSAGNTLASGSYAAIQGTTVSTAGSAAVYGISTGNGFGVRGDIPASGGGEAAVYGQNERTAGGHGVMGLGVNGVVGQSNYTDGFGCYGFNYGTADPGIGVYGGGVTGVAGQSTNLSLSYGLYSFDDCGIYNALDVGGNLYAGGTKSFRIDHPLDPDNKFLVHFCIESDEILNLYRGTTVLDSNGEAEIVLPDYFGDVNTNFAYQLTPVGAAMPNLYVSSEINDNRFRISGGVAGAKVSWTVTAERNDRLVQQNPEMRNAEPEKTGKFKGKYVHPQLYSRDAAGGILYRNSPALHTDLNPRGSHQPVYELNH